mmetsp:Transcript_3750/g.6393  ORF Transcript_3750/g.6393 Transcript_3750/m.6393 type:complete len:207 (+) Transcript_3750:18-638(+)
MDSKDASTTASGRLQSLNSHFEGSLQGPQVMVGGQLYHEVYDNEPSLKTKLDYFNKQGWGYKDTSFIVDRKKNVVKFTGNQYLYSGKTLPNLLTWINQKIKLDTSKPHYPQAEMEIDPPQNVNHQFLNDLLLFKSFSRISFEHWERIMHSHGASLREIFNLRFGRFDRYVDVVVYPGSSDQVKMIVDLASKHKVAVVPYGGGTNVT